MNDTPLVPTEADTTTESGASVDDFPEINTPAWDAMNRRRWELLRKKNREGLTAEEAVEFERLQTKTLEAMQRAYPAPNLVDKRMLAELNAQLPALLLDAKE